MVIARFTLNPGTRALKTRLLVLQFDPAWTAQVLLLLEAQLLLLPRVPRVLPPLVLLHLVRLSPPDPPPALELPKCCLDNTQHGENWAFAKELNFSSLFLLANFGIK